MISLYGVWRLLAAWRIARGYAHRRDDSPNVLLTYHTRRSLRLIEAAWREAGKRLAVQYTQGPSDRSVVYLGNDWECRWWGDKLGATPSALRNAVVQVGPMVADIERYLAMRSHNSKYRFAA